MKLLHSLGELRESSSKQLHTLKANTLGVGWTRGRAVASNLSICCDDMEGDGVARGSIRQNVLHTAIVASEEAHALASQVSLTFIDSHFQGLHLNSDMAELSLQHVALHGQLGAGHPGMLFEKGRTLWWHDGQVMFANCMQTSCFDIDQTGHNTQTACLQVMQQTAPASVPL